MAKNHKRNRVPNRTQILTRDFDENISSANSDKPQVGIRQERTFAFEVREVNEKERKVHVSFSSEQGVSRLFGQEILCHDKEAIDFTRLKDLGVSLFNHNRDYVIGIPQNITLNETEKRCHADLIFDDDEDSEKIYRKVVKGFLRGISVGYSVQCWEEVKAGETSSNGRFKGPAYIATKWTPLEVSIVSVPADSDVGVNRNFEENITTKKVQSTERERTMDLQELCRSLGLDYDALIARGFEVEAIRSMCSAVQQRAEKACEDKKKEEEAAAEDKKKKEEAEKEGKKSATEIEQRALKEASERSVEIATMCRDFGEDAIPYIKEGKTVDEVRQAILTKVKTERAAMQGGNIQFVGDSEQEKIRAAAVDGLLLRGQISIEKPAEGANNFRGMKLRDLAIDCLEREGVHNAHRLNDDELFKRAVTPDSQFTGILSDSVNKSMATTYKAANVTYDKWCSKGSASDFKEASVYQLSEGGNLERVTQTGELKHDEPKDNKVTKQVLTYGKTFGFTRKALINDDIGMLTKVPAAYVRAALRGRNKLVYKTLCNTTDNIYDGKKLFHADHANLGTAGALATAKLAELIKLMRKQKNIRGKETLNIAPQFLIVPAALEMTAAQLLVSTADPSASNSGVANIYKNSLNLIVDAEIDDYSSTAYYVAANPADIDTIEVTYLNGNEQPILESQVGFDFLGIKWRIIDDFGVAALDYRGLAKNAGA